MSFDYVYLIKKSSGGIKIGVSKNPESRLKQLQTSCGEKLSIVARLPFKSRKQAFEFEKILHIKFSKYRIGGEWFKSCILSKFCSSENLLPDFVTCKYQYEIEEDQKSHIKEIINSP